MAPSISYMEPLLSRLARGEDSAGHAQRSTRRSRCGPLVVVALVAGSGCSGEGPHPDASLTDSAGVSIVRSTSALWGERQLWRVEEHPRPDLARSGGGEAHEFFKVRDAVRLQGGSIVVANAGSSEVRFFDSEGTFLTAAGARGDGPGEFRGPDGIGRYPGDSVAVFDRSHKRVTIFDHKGTMGRTLTLTVDAPVDELHVKGDGSFLARVTRTDALAAMGQAVGRIRVPQDILEFSPTGELLDTFVSVRGFETFLFERGDAQPPLRKESFVFVSNEAVVVGDADDMAYNVYAEDGRLRQRVQIPEYPLGVSGELQSSLQEELTQMDAPDFIREVNRRMAKAIPQRMPAYVDLLGDPDGYVWLGLYHRPGEPQKWVVFDSLGTWVGSVSLPKPLEVYEIGHDYLLGKGVNGDGSETVELLGLIRE